MLVSLHFSSLTSHITSYPKYDVLSWPNSACFLIKSFSNFFLDMYCGMKYWNIQVVSGDVKFQD